MRRMEKKIDNLKEYIKDEVENIKTRKVDDREELLKEVRERVLWYLKEETDKKIRKNNLIIYGAVESDSPDPREQGKYYEELCNEILCEGVKILVAPG